MSLIAKESLQYLVSSARKIPISLREKELESRCELLITALDEYILSLERMVLAASRGEATDVKKLKRAKDGLQKILSRRSSDFVVPTPASVSVEDD